MYDWTIQIHSIRLIGQLKYIVYVRLDNSNTKYMYDWTIEIYSIHDWTI